MRTLEIKSKWHRFILAVFKKRTLKIGRVKLYYGIDTLEVTEDLWTEEQSLTVEYIGIDITYSGMFRYFCVNLIIVGLEIKL